MVVYNMTQRNRRGATAAGKNVCVAYFLSFDSVRTQERGVDAHSEKSIRIPIAKCVVADIIHQKVMGKQRVRSIWERWSWAHNAIRKFALKVTQRSNAFGMLPKEIVTASSTCRAF